MVKAIARGWAKKWEAKRWMAKADRPRINADLWQQL
jgi:ribonuclease HI